MLSRYSKNGFPSEFPVRSKCIALFQKLQGVDVLLFGMYVYEYGHDCPAPNRRRVYISYLDSVKYFRPDWLRTQVYQSIVVEYLRYVKERGFHTAHIWSCPPSPGDDFIFHCHPPHQQTPRADMLRNWYTQVLEAASSAGIVLGVSSLHDEYFKNNGMDATGRRATDPSCLPYFEGDYVPGEIENILKELASEDESMKTNDDETDAKGAGQDKVMLRLGQTIGKMKQNFFVVHLRNRDFAAAVERGEDVSGWMEDDDMSNKRMKIGGKDASALYPSHVDTKPKGTMEKRESETSTDASLESTKLEDDPLEPLPPGDDTPLSHVEDVLELRGGGDSKLDMHSDKGSHAHEDDVGSLGTVSVSLDPHGEDDHDPSKTFGVDDHDTERGDDDGDKDKDDLMPVSLDLEPVPTPGTDQKPSTKSSSKRGFDEIEPTLNRHFAAVEASRKPIGSTEDEDEPQDTEMFESRQQFLNYCQTNNFQFDELRRAKHATMMLLFHLHNPSAPKVLSQYGRRQQQQLLMDDRRRQAQNELCKGSVESQAVQSE